MSERSESKRIGAKQHKNSGRNNTKGDASWNNFVIDFKECSKSFTLNQDVWAKATTDALKEKYGSCLDYRTWRGYTKSTPCYNRIRYVRTVNRGEQKCQVKVHKKQH
jgi:hypothetical protein